MIYHSIQDILSLGISFTKKYLSLKNELLPTKAQTHRRTSSLPSDSESEFPTPLNSTQISSSEFLDFVKYIDDRFLRAIPFIRSGLKGSIRAAEFPSLGILAASLEAGIR